MILSLWWIGDGRGIRVRFLLPGRGDHGQDARAERFRQRRPGVEEALQIGADSVRIGRKRVGLRVARLGNRRFSNVLRGEFNPPWGY